jgi:Flp pilus assembly protein TadD
MDNMGYTLFIQGNSADGALLIEKSIQRNPRRGYVFGSRAHLRFVKGDHAGALDDFRHARELHYEPENRQIATAGEAITLYQIGQIEEARTLWRTLREEDASFRTVAAFEIANVWAEPCAKIAHQLIQETAS